MATRRCKNCGKLIKYCVCPRSIRLGIKKNTDITLASVANQEHYTQFPIQVMTFCHVNGLSWCAANVVKYVCREAKKDGVKDLYKAMDYLRCLIHYRETGEFLPPSELEKNHEK